MSNRVSHLHDPAVAPLLEATDIPRGRGGMSVGVIERGGETSSRELAEQSIHVLASVTAQLRRAEAVIVALRDENRALRMRFSA